MNPELEAYYKAKAAFEEYSGPLIKGSYWAGYSPKQVLGFFEDTFDTHLNMGTSIQIRKCPCQFDTLEYAFRCKFEFEEAYAKLTDEEKVMLKLSGDAP